MRPAALPPPPHPARGFTLVEVMVALLILAIMSAMAWQGVDSLMRTRGVTQARLEALLRSQSVMAQWEADLQALVNVQVAPPVRFDGSTLHLTRRHPDGVQVVAWTLRSGALTRWSAPPTTRSEALQEAWMESFQLLGNEPGQLRTLEGVSQWQIYFYRGNAWTNPQSTGDVAAPPPPAAGGSAPQGQPRPTKDAPPDAVRLVVTFAEGGTLAGTVTRDVRLTP